jgi:hypothetical protein
VKGEPATTVEGALISRMAWPAVPQLSDINPSTATLKAHGSRADSLPSPGRADLAKYLAETRTKPGCALDTLSSSNAMALGYQDGSEFHRASAHHERTADAEI